MNIISEKTDAIEFVESNKKYFSSGMKLSIEERKTQNQKRNALLMLFISLQRKDICRGMQKSFILARYYVEGQPEDKEYLLAKEYAKEIQNALKEKYPETEVTINL